MAQHQISLGLDTGYEPAPPVVPDIKDEIAAAWGLPLGHRVEVGLRGSDRSAISGILELAKAPDFPWDPRQPLMLRVRGFLFSSREIGHWTKI